MAGKHVHLGRRRTTPTETVTLFRIVVVPKPTSSSIAPNPASIAFRNRSSPCDPGLRVQDPPSGRKRCGSRSGWTGISGMGAGRVDLDHDAQRAFLAETHHRLDARLAIEHAVATELLGKVRPAIWRPRRRWSPRRTRRSKSAGRRAPRGDGADRDIGPDRGRSAHFHVGDAAAMHFSVLDRTAPRIARRGARPDLRGKNVDMAVEHQMAPLAAAIEAADDIGQMLLGGPDFHRTPLARNCASRKSAAGRVSPGGFGLGMATKADRNLMSSSRSSSIQARMRSLGVIISLHSAVSGSGVVGLEDSLVGACRMIELKWTNDYSERL